MAHERARERAVRAAEVAFEKLESDSEGNLSKK